MTDISDWLMASNGTSVHWPLLMTKDWPFPAAICGRRGLSRIRTTRRSQDGKPMSPCRNCMRIKANRDAYTGPKESE